ncbi:signal peptidase II [Cellulomonas sp. ACRRI]|uniref:signal peptidase II n=1 Tax=Cellulomonas sp. ACRRI TaxID=2918188 RepID=UPI001EF23CB0|nr:signal peptidase II [Cellulomonas sp. ACRRI]MCG7285547.1 signal peptidase II [Cellulomonas sp. ACRRI]
MSATSGPAADDARRDAASAAPVPPASHPAAPGAGAPQAPASTPVVVAPARRRRLVATLVALAAVTLVLDQATKAWALAGLDEGVRHPVLGDLLGLQLLFNPGAALGLATGTTWLLTVVAITVVVVIVRVSRRLGSTGWTIALGLLLGGALGNLVDRLIREPGVFVGHVVDFIAYGDLFVGNVADIAIVAAAGLLMLLSLMGVRLDGTRERREEPAAEDAATDGAGDAAGDAAGSGRADG